jgi:rare lipoprotein A
VTKRRPRAAVAVLVLLLVFASCGKKRPRLSKLPPVPQVSIGATEEGVASWYGHPYHGRPTSSGEIYDMEKMTAAHRTLPLGTRVIVENVSNGRQVEVRINDRGPFAGNRILDLSHAAARQIEMIGPGTARVRIRVTGLPDAVRPGFFTVQVGAFQSRENAERLRERLAGEYGSAFIQNFNDPRGIFYRVRVGRAGAEDDAAALAEKLRQENFTTFVVRVDEPGAGTGL